MPIKLNGTTIFDESNFSNINLSNITNSAKNTMFNAGKPDLTATATSLASGSTLTSNGYLICTTSTLQNLTSVLYIDGVTVFSWACSGSGASIGFIYTLQVYSGQIISYANMASVLFYPLDINKV